MKNVDVEEAKKLYEEGLSLHEIGKRLGCSRDTVTTRLSNAGVEIRNRGGKPLDRVYVVPDWKIEKYKPVDGFHYVAKSRDGKFSTVYSGSGGCVIMKYINTEMNVDVPTIHNRREYYKMTGNYWWEQFFDIVMEKDLPAWKCPYCGWKTVDTKNKSGVIFRHLREVHAMRVEDYIKSHPEEASLFKTEVSIAERKERIENEGYVVCPICGEKLISMTASHLLKHGLTLDEFENAYPDFMKEVYRERTESFIERARKVHGDKYSYENTVYKNSQKKVEIRCNTCGHVFLQNPKAHLLGQGCPQCANIQSRSNTEEFIRKAKGIHGDKYDYSHVDYINSSTDVEIICPVHGPFCMTPHEHLQGRGCRECGIVRKSKKMTKTTDEFVEHARKVHGDKYSYDNVVYVNGDTPVGIVCNTCEKEFAQMARVHLSGCGCPSCSRTTSKAEIEIADYISGILGEGKVKARDRELLDGQEIDILIPEKKLGIEFDGLHWHSEKYKDSDFHLSKTVAAEEKGYHLIHIFEDEWVYRKETVLGKIRHIIGGDSALPRIGARKCQISQCSLQDAKVFLEKYHIQGFVASTVYLGAYHDGRLVGLMCFLRESGCGFWNMVRYATDTSAIYPGLASKLFKHFLDRYGDDVVEVKTFLDRRWGVEGDNVYTKMGFVLDGYVKPDYRYIVGNERKHKFRFRKKILHEKYGVPLEWTEREMCSYLGFLRIYDCGLIKYVYKKK